MWPTGTFITQLLITSAHSPSRMLSSCWGRRRAPQKFLDVEPVVKILPFHPLALLLWGVPPE